MYGFLNEMMFKKSNSSSTIFIFFWTLGSTRIFRREGKRLSWLFLHWRVASLGKKILSPVAFPLLSEVGLKTLRWRDVSDGIKNKTERKHWCGNSLQSNNRVHRGPLISNRIVCSTGQPWRGWCWWLGWRTGLESFSFYVPPSTRLAFILSTCRFHN